MKKCSLLLLLALLVFSCAEREDILPDEGVDPEIDHGGLDPEEDGLLSQYRVVGSQIELVQDFNVNASLQRYQDDKGRHLAMWDYVTQLFNAAHRRRLTEFIVFYGDGEFQGYVEPIDPSDLSRWRMGLAIDAATDLSAADLNDFFTFVVIHEFGHIVSLNESQLDAQEEAGTCPYFFAGEGCSFRNSYINTLYDLGWKDIYAEHDEQNPTRTYNRYRDRFVSEYAATNPGEDFAEVFSFFVVGDQPPTGNGIAAQKIRLLYGYSELLEIRRSIRENVDLSGLTSGSLGEFRAKHPEVFSKMEIHTH
ncbi:hypothetical protein [Lewinella sp. W8]|uniref:hypothetical protein n=1 Tax=Lewinella sp. W8 TaxID=2528208 RepID=UPI0010678429|nr:hypothetical protein [Lewinella sp. W8]MTB51310.1 hypothetical protein [Lewinella sp. W8]